jgi:hypothetical protein
MSSLKNGKMDVFRLHPLNSNLKVCQVSACFFCHFRLSQLSFPIIKNGFYEVLIPSLLSWHQYLQHIFLQKNREAGMWQIWKLGGKEPKYSQRHLLALLLVTNFTDVYLVVNAVLFEVENLHVPHINLKARVQAQEKGQKSYIMLSLINI